MKRTCLTTALIIILIALAWVNLLAQGTKKTGSKIKWYEIEKIYIEYENAGMFKGLEKFYLGDWGNDELTIKDVVMEMGPMKQRTHTATYLKGDKIYTVDLETNKGTVTENPMRSAKSEKQAKQAGEEFMKQFGQEVGTEEFLGRMCRVFEMPGLGSRTLVWKNITLKSETGMGNMKHTRTAVKITSEYDKKILNLPTDIIFEEGQNFEDIMKKIKGKY